MRLILDASAAIEVVLDRSKARRFAHVLEEADEVLAPELLVAEVVNTVWKYHQFENLSLTRFYSRSRRRKRGFSLAPAFRPGSRAKREGAGRFNGLPEMASATGRQVAEAGSLESPLEAGWPCLGSGTQP